MYIDGYQWYGHSREEKGGGGVGFLIKNELTNLIEDTSVGTLDELKWIRLKAKQNIYIGIYYGPQENIDKELVEEQYCSSPARRLAGEAGGEPPSDNRSGLPPIIREEWVDNNKNNIVE